MFPQLSRAGEWFLRSGIHESTGGVARYYRADLDRNLPVSTEITGYAVSALVYLHSVTGDQRYLEEALLRARFLSRAAWDRALPKPCRSSSTPRPSPTSSIAGSLSAACSLPGAPPVSASSSSGRRDRQIHGAGFLLPPMATASIPILSLPDKRPLPRDPLRWSRSPGCYQLKSAMAWWDLAEATGDAQFRQPYERALAYSLRTWTSFLPGHPDRLKVMDRLHAFLYFLEGLLPRAGDPPCAAALCAGIHSVARTLRDIAPEFERSDVYAQLLRIRLYADWAGVAPLDLEAAAFEADRLAQFQVSMPTRASMAATVSAAPATPGRRT